MTTRGVDSANLSLLSPQEREEFILSLTPEEAEQLAYDWFFWARPKQIPPFGDWRIWLVMAGRGFGKTRTGAEFIRWRQENNYSRFALIGPTAADARDIMVEGESGIINISPPWNRPVYHSSLRKIEWPNGAFGLLFTADEPERLRGPQFDTAWCDELGAWRYTGAYDQLQFGMRLSRDPRVVVTTTPRPIPIVVKLYEQAKDPKNRIVITEGTTYENVGNLPEAYVIHVMSEYKDTKLGQQELEGKLLMNVEGAPWHRDLIRYRTPTSDLTRIVVAADPTTAQYTPTDERKASITEKRKNECGIIIVGLDSDQIGYVLDDYTIQGGPNEWAAKIVEAYDVWKADRVVAEINQGGGMIEALIRTIRRNISYTPVTAMRGKVVRTEPIVALYEQQKVFHVKPFEELENQMCTWLPGQKSPDRMDALVWGLTHLMVKDEKRLPFILAQAVARIRSA